MISPFQKLSDTAASLIGFCCVCVCKNDNSSIFSLSARDRVPAPRQQASKTDVQEHTHAHDAAEGQYPAAA